MPELTLHTNQLKQSTKAFYLKGNSALAGMMCGEREREAQAVTINLQIPDDILQTSTSSGSERINLSDFGRFLQYILIFLLCRIGDFHTHFFFLLK